jgi:hypothetical protein
MHPELLLQYADRFDPTDLSVTLRILQGDQRGMKKYRVRCLLRKMQAKLHCAMKKGPPTRGLIGDQDILPLDPQELFLHRHQLMRSPPMDPAKICELREMECMIRKLDGKVNRYTQELLAHQLLT